MKSLLKAEWKRIRQRPGKPFALLALLLLFFRLSHLLWSFIQGRYYFRKANQLGTFVFTRKAPYVQQQGSMNLGNLVRIWSNINPTHLLIGKDAVLSIGDRSYINGALISVTKKVEIGANCYIAPMVQIIDSDQFGLGLQNQKEEAAAIIIEEDAWLATRCLITKGVTIGKGAVVAVGAVVTEDVAPYTVVAGAPAKLIKRLSVREPKKL